MTRHFALLLQQLVVVVFWTYDGAAALDCTRVDLSCPADFGHHHHKKKKKQTATTITTADERRVPICVVKKNKKGQISYETRCKGETEEIELHKHETSYHCGCCSSSVHQEGPKEEALLPEFCLSGRTTTPQEQPQEEASFETNAVTTTTTTPATAKASTTEATLQANAVTTTNTTAVFETNAVVNETCTVEEQVLCDPTAILSGKGKGSRSSRRLHSPESSEPFWTAPRGSATGSKLLRQGNGLVTQQQQEQHRQRRSLKMMKMNGKSTTTIAPGSIAICTTTTTTAKGKGKQKTTMCVDPLTTDVSQPFTCGCCPGQEELCIMPTVAPTTNNMTMPSLFTNMGCYTQGNCVFSHNAVGSAPGSQYLVDDACTWTVTTSGTLTAEYFALEEGFDFLTVAGVRFTGTGVDSSSASGSSLVIEGFAVNAGDTLVFYSDEIVTDTGFKVCLV